MWRVLRPFVFFVALMLLAPWGYVILEGWGFPEAFYMSLITVTTVGFGEVRPLSEAGRLFTSVLILFGIGTFTYAITHTTSSIIEGRINERWRRKKMINRIAELKDHYIICGAGATGKWVIREFLRTHSPCVVVERNRRRLEELKEQFPGLLWVEGDATDEEVLAMAGVARAKGLLALLSTDADNLFLVVTAKGMNPDLYVISRAKDEKSVNKLLQGGADRVVSPAVTEGVRMASLALRPEVVSFLDVVIYEGHEVLRLEEVTIPEDSPWVGKFLGDLDVQHRTEALVIGLKMRETGEVVFNPSRMTLLEGGDVLILLGTEPQLQRARQLIATNTPSWAVDHRAEVFDGLEEVADPR